MGGHLEVAALAAAVRRLRRLRCPWKRRWTGAAEGIHTPLGYLDPGAVRREGVVGRGKPRTQLGFPGGRDWPRFPFKNVLNKDRDGKGLRRWRSANDDHAEDNANDDDEGERGATAAYDEDDSSNREEYHVDDNYGRGRDWVDVNVDKF